VKTTSMSRWVCQDGVGERWEETEKKRIWVSRMERVSGMSISKEYLEWVSRMSIRNEYLEWVSRMSIWNEYLEWVSGMSISNEYLETCGSRRCMTRGKILLLFNSTSGDCQKLLLYDPMIRYDSSLLLWNPMSKSHTSIKIQLVVIVKELLLYKFNQYWI